MALNLDTALLRISMDTYDPQTGNTKHLNAHSLLNKMLHFETELNYLSYRSLSVYMVRQYHDMFEKQSHIPFKDITVNVIQAAPRSEPLQLLTAGRQRYYEHLDRQIDNALERAEKNMDNDAWYDTAELNCGYAAYIDYQHYVEEQHITACLFTKAATHITIPELNTLLDQADYMDQTRSKRLTFNSA